MGGSDLDHRAEIPGIGHEVQRRHVRQRVGQPQERPLQLVGGQAGRVSPGEHPPRPGRVERRLRQVDRAEADILVRGQFQFLEDRGAEGDDHFSVRGPGRLRELLEHAYVDRDLGVRVVVTFTRRT